MAGPERQLDKPKSKTETPKAFFYLQLKPLDETNDPQKALDRILKEAKVPNLDAVKKAELLKILGKVDRFNSSDKPFYERGDVLALV